MAPSKFTLYKYVKLQGGWRYCKAAFHDNSKIKPNDLHTEAEGRKEERNGWRLALWVNLPRSRSNIRESPQHWMPQ